MGMNCGKKGKERKEKAKGAKGQKNFASCQKKQGETSYLRNQTRYMQQLQQQEDKIATLSKQVAQTSHHLGTIDCYIKQLSLVMVNLFITLSHKHKSSLQSCALGGVRHHLIGFISNIASDDDDNRYSRARLMSVHLCKQLIVAQRES